MENKEYKSKNLNNINESNNYDEEIIEETIDKTDSENYSKDKQELDETTKIIEELKNKNNDLLDKLQRSLAEFDNFRKRTSKEKSNMYDDGVKDTVEKFLSLIDNFERALLSITDKESNIYKGLKMVYKQFEDILSELGVDNIKCIGEKFDPKLHFAVSHEEDNSYGENEIIEELQKGYIYKDKIIRCSMVKVAN